VWQPGEPAWPPAWTYHSTGIASWDRIGKIEEYVDPAGPADFIRNLGTAHGEYLRDRLERQRRGVPDGTPAVTRRNWGSTVWRLNDPWPMIYSSLLDYYLEPKIPCYFTRRANDPILVSFERTADRIFVWVVNDSPEPAGGQLVVRRMDFNGKVLGEMDTYVQIAPAQSKRVLDLTAFGFITLRGEFLHATFEGRDSTLLLIGEKYLHLPKASLKVRKLEDGIEITTDVFARQVTLEATAVVGAVFEDNYFDMAPQQKRTIKVVYPAGGREVIIRALNAAPVKLTL
jgi:beta-mannosidase